MSLTKEEIKKFEKLQDKADDNTEMNSYYKDDEEYYYGNLAEDLCDAGDKEWARKIYKIVEDKMGLQIGSDSHITFANDVAINLGDKEWARKIYKEALETASSIYEIVELAESIIENLGDKKWGEEVYIKAEENAEDSDEFKYLEESILKCLDDKKLVKKIRERLKKKH